MDYASPETYAAGQRLIAAGTGEDARGQAQGGTLSSGCGGSEETDARDLYF